jgi:death-on-curing protein
MTNKEIIFLELDDVLEIHKDLIELCGGSYGIRDEGLLHSAIEMPKSGFGNEYFHKDLFEMASAYLFHLCKNHPFVDGNKRIALACADTFLKVNGVHIKATGELLYNFVLEVASSNTVTKENIADFFRKNS